MRTPPSPTFARRRQCVGLVDPGGALQSHEPEQHRLGTGAKATTDLPKLIEAPPVAAVHRPDGVIGQERPQRHERGGDLVAVALHAVFAPFGGAVRLVEIAQAARAHGEMRQLMEKREEPAAGAGCRVRPRSSESGDAGEVRSAPPERPGRPPAPRLPRPLVKADRCRPGVSRPPCASRDTRPSRAPGSARPASRGLHPRRGLWRG